MAFDAGHLFPSVVAFGAGAVRVFHALCINDAKARLGVASLFLSSRANLIFLMPLQQADTVFRRGTPQGKIVVDGAPLAAAFQQVQDRAKHIVQINGARAGFLASRF